MFFMGLILTFHNYEAKLGGFYYIISYWSLWIVMVSCKTKHSWQSFVLNTICVFTLFYAAMTIISFCSRSFYFTFILPLFDYESQKQLTIAYNNGFMAGLTDHYSSNGMYLAIGVGAFTAKVFANPKSFPNWILLGVVAIALLLTGKRGPLLFSVMAILVIYYFFEARKPKGRFLKILGIICLGIIAILIASIWIPQLLNVVNRFVSESDSGDVSAGRGPLFQLAWDLFLKKPIFGYGWGNYPYQYYEELGRHMTVYQYRNAHNIYLQLLCETGIVGFTVFVTFFISQVWACMKLYKKLRKEEVNLPKSAEYILPFALYCEIFFLLYGMTGNPLYDVMILFPYLLSCMFVNSYQYQCFPEKSYRLVLDLFQKSYDKKLIAKK